MFPLLSLLLIPAVVAHKAPAHNAHRAAAHNASLAIRDGPGYRFSNYDAADSEGACGGWNTNSQYVVAVSQLDWDNGAHCNKQVYITYNGMSAVAEIVDECEECPHMALDFSQSLFGHFVGGEQNNDDVGYIYGGWVYGTGPSDNGGDDDTTTKKQTTTSTTKQTTTHTTSTTSHTSTTHTSTSTSTSTTASSISKSSSAAGASKSSAPSSTGSTASSTPTGTGVQNIEDFTQALLNLAGLAVQAPHAT
ncbi:hypothetical protein C8F04DRAFT_655295 [Mycena alexandri]|uniref:Uncharacterized protein n=1 Tax=Mycena alexandri TaxID=1745969 RepID=A0AAD6SRL8_9AGAR|nr:hypothetical protein C8F04DRAFT_655295 [Mycena alexandri]